MSASEQLEEMRQECARLDEEMAEYRRGRDAKWDEVYRLQEEGLDEQVERLREELRHELVGALSLCSRLRAARTRHAMASVRYVAK
jgi:hypothetical protein